MSNGQPQVQNIPQPVPSQARSKIPIKSSSKSIYLVACFVVGLLMILSAVGGVYIGSKYLASKEEDETSDGETPETNGEESNGETTDDDGTAYAEGSIKVTSPVSDQEVNGKIFVEGEASDFLEELTIKVYDDDWNVIAESTAALESGGSNLIRSWSVFADVTQSPTSLTGHVRVFPTERGESSKLTKTINVRFQNLLAPGRLKLFAPLKSQIMEGSAVTFRGQMKDFLEGILGVRLVDESDREIVDETITAKSDNYGKYAQFEKSIEHKRDLSYYGDRGTWEIYEVDIEGNPGKIILSLPVRFPEK